MSSYMYMRSPRAMRHKSHRGDTSLPCQGGGIGRDNFDSSGARKRDGPVRKISRILKKASRKIRQSLFGDGMRRKKDVKEMVSKHNWLVKGDKGPTMKAANVFWPPTQENTPTKFFVMADRDARGRKLNEPQLVKAQRWTGPDGSPVWEPYLHFGTDSYGRNADGWIQAAGRRKR